MSISMAKGLNC